MRLRVGAPSGTPDEGKRRYDLLADSDGNLCVSLDDESKALLTRIAEALERQTFDGGALRTKGIL